MADDHDILSQTDPERRGKSRELVVLIHGWAGPRNALHEVRSLIETQLPDADILQPRFASGLVSNTSVFELAAAVEDLIQLAVDQRERLNDGTGYDSILLVGYSLGALLVRKAFVYGSGMREDYPIQGLTGIARPWTRKVSRIILLAGMNRGWSLTPKPEHMSVRRWLLSKASLIPARWFGFGQLIRSVERGAPFVANLRVQWARLYARSASKPGPRVVQLLGTIDDLVAEGDQTDLFTTPGFTYIPLVQTGHVNVLRLGGSLFAQQRARVLRDALCLTDDALEAEYGPGHRRAQVRQDLGAEEHVVFIMHGIRDPGHWTQAIADEFRRLAPEVSARTARYRYFPMGAFLLLNQREKFVRWFMDLYTEEVAKNPDVQVSFVGHSNGTYILARAMELYPVLRVHRVVFAGSVVRRDYPWSRWRDADRLDAIQNYRAASDYVVAIFPRFFELIRENLPVMQNDIGSGGFLGFQDAIGNAHEVTVRGGHGGALDPRNHEPIVRFVVRGDAAAANDLIVDRLHSGAFLASRLCWAIWASLAAGAVALGVGAVWLLSPQVAPAITIAVYIALIIVLLQTV